MPCCFDVSSGMLKARQVPWDPSFGTHAPFWHPLSAFWLSPDAPGRHLWPLRSLTGASLDYQAWLSVPVSGNCATSLEWQGPSYNPWLVTLLRWFQATGISGIHPGTPALPLSNPFPTLHSDFFHRTNMIMLVLFWKPSISMKSQIFVVLHDWDFFHLPSFVSRHISLRIPTTKNYFQNPPHPYTLRVFICALSPAWNTFPWSSPPLFIKTQTKRHLLHCT